MVGIFEFLAMSPNPGNCVVQIHTGYVAPGQPPALALSHHCH